MAQNDRRKDAFGRQKSKKIGAEGNTRPENASPAKPVNRGVNSKKGTGGSWKQGSGTPKKWVHNRHGLETTWPKARREKKNDHRRERL